MSACCHITVILNKSLYLLFFLLLSLSNNIKYCLGVNFLNNNERLTLLNIHNKYRADVTNNKYNTLQYGFQPGASNMNSLFWDISLESLAMDYATQCIKGHNPNRNMDIFNYQQIAGFEFANNMFIGESWYSSPLKIDAIAVSKLDPLLNGINWFFSEIKDYNYSKIYQSIAGHYTQIVWANTRYVGCGYSSCDFGTLIVCNYWPPGNIPGQYPYLSSQQSQCSQCQADRTCDANNLWYFLCIYVSI